MKKTILITIASAVVASVFTILFFKTTGWEANKQTLKIEHVTSPRSAALFTTNAEGEIVPLDFTKVAEDVMSAVVHIKSTQVGVAGQTPYGPNPNPFRDFFGDDFFDQFFFYPDGRERNRGTPPARVGTGSGVLITDDGYIVTNNHVIANASDIEVTLHDNRTYKAKVVGTDPSTDLALIQIKENGLPFLPFGNSDEVKVGEWVLAVAIPSTSTRP
jgi:serine protease Do